VKTMPGNTKAIVRDVNAQPAPQIFDPSKDAYDYLLGQNGAMRTLLYDANGNPLLTQANPGYVDLIDRASRILGKISADDGAIAALGALAAAAITDPAQNASVIALLKGLLKQLQGTGTGAAPVQLTGSSIQENQALPVYSAGRKIETVFTRQIRTSSGTQVYVPTPAGVKGCVVRAFIYGATGTFASGQGLAVALAFARTPTVTTLFAPSVLSERVNRQYSESTIIVYPGVTGDASDFGNFSKIKRINAQIFGSVRVNASITGTFGEGQGIDCDVTIEWLT
jgi:hypothetical protein